MKDQFEAIRAKRFYPKEVGDMSQEEVLNEEVLVTEKKSKLSSRLRIAVLDRANFIRKYRKVVPPTTSGPGGELPLSPSSEDPAR